MRWDALVIEMLELGGFEHKFLPPYTGKVGDTWCVENDTFECMFSEWRRYEKLGLQGHRAWDEEDLQARRRAFELVPAHASAYCRHIGNNCLSFIEGVRIFDN
jgi:hypothetical protein